MLLETPYFDIHSLLRSFAEDESNVVFVTHVNCFNIFRLRAFATTVILDSSVL